jgi:hypothetical protein
VLPSRSWEVHSERPSYRRCVEGSDDDLRSSSNSIRMRRRPGLRACLKLHHASDATRQQTRRRWPSMVHEVPGLVARDGSRQIVKLHRRRTTIL